MRRHKSIRRFGMLLFLCISCVAVMTALAFDNRGEGAGGDKGEETIVGWMIDRIAAGEIELSDENSIRQAISEGEEKFGLSLTEENKTRIVEFMQTLDTIESGAGDFIEQAKQKYRKYSTELVEEANDAINGAVESALKNAVRSFLQSFISDEHE